MPATQIVAEKQYSIHLRRKPGKEPPAFILADRTIYVKKDGLRPDGERCGRTICAPDDEDAWKIFARKGARIAPEVVELYGLDVKDGRVVQDLRKCDIPAAG